jgi:hypothetical protein
MPRRGNLDAEYATNGVREADYQIAGHGMSEYTWVRKRAGGGKASAPAARLIELAAIRRAADELLTLEVRRLRTEAKWATWERIGEVLGITKQAAAQRFRGDLSE